MASDETGTEDLAAQAGITLDNCDMQLADPQSDQGMMSSVSVDGSNLHTMTITPTQSGSGNDSEQEEPPSKRVKISEVSVTNTNMNNNLNQDQSIKQLLFTINKAICMRLDGIENSIEILNGRTKYLEEKMEEVLQQVKQNGSTGAVVTPTGTKKGAVIVGLPQGGIRSDQPAAHAAGLNSVDGIQNMGLGPNVTLITLNSEDDFPSGTWLGDETNPEMRVRVPITPSDLLHIHSNCRTPEKMALTMLDYLFDRECQANSNLSGMGKHGKKQLDPLMIYGIRCHLIHRFGINEGDWHRIKQNIDSKCRTAFRRKQRGMPLTVKAFRGKSTPTYVVGQNGEELLSDEDSLQDGELRIHQVEQFGDLDLQKTVAAMQTEGLSTGEIQILHATPEQISQLQQAHHIQILQGDQVIQVPMPMAPGTDDNLQVVSIPQPDSIHVASSEGEVIQLQQMESDMVDT